MAPLGRSPLERERVVKKYFKCFSFHKVLENVQKTKQKKKTLKKSKKRSNFVRFSFQNSMIETRYEKKKSEGIGEEF